MDYKKSVELALSLGYQKVPDENAFNGTYYIKNKKIWIHDIDALKKKLVCTSNSELVDLGYDVGAYNKYRNHTNEMADTEMKSFYSAITHEDGEPTYLMDGMYLFPDGSIGEL